MFSDNLPWDLGEAVQAALSDGAEGGTGAAVVGELLPSANEAVEHLAC